MDAEVFQASTSPHSCAPCKPCDWHLCGCSLCFLSEAVHRYKLTALSTQFENLDSKPCHHRMCPMIGAIPAVPYLYYEDGRIFRCIPVEHSCPSR